MKLKFPDHVVLIVEDLDRALSFYTDLLGLQLGHRLGDYAQRRTGATRLAFYTRKAMSKTLGYSLNPPSDAAPGFEIGFKVEDVDEAFLEIVQKGARAATRPTTRPWGQRTAYFRDPDGHLIDLVQDLD